jgi:hypothetical protein
MKTIISGLILFGTTLVAAAQGNIVTFVNNLQPFPTPTNRLVYDVHGNPLVGTNYVAQLYYGSTPSTLVAHTAAPAKFRPPETFSPGTWIGSVRTLTGFTGGEVISMQVRVWDIALYPTYNQATEDMTGAQYGKSDVFSYTVPMPGHHPREATMDNLRSFKLVTNPPPNVLAIRENGNRVDIIYKGTHTIQATENLGGPWTTVANDSSPFADPDSATLTRRFYRINDGGVFSANAVGYYRADICNNFSIIANQLMANGGNAISNVFTSPPNGSQVYKFNPATVAYTFMQFIDGAWEGNHLDVQLNPGEGIFFYSPVPYTHRFLGEILAVSAVPIPSGFSIISSALPMAASLPALNFPAATGDQVYQWNCSTGSYLFNQFFDGVWEGDSGGNPPFLAVGEAFFMYNPGPARNWARSFTVGP